MTFADLVAYAKKLPFFTGRMLEVAQLGVQERPIGRSSLAVAVQRWVAAGRIERLAHGVYRLAEPFAEPLNHTQAAALASQLVEPSYLSLAWALQFHGLIPDAVREFTSVTRKPARTFSNSGGRYSYRNLHGDLWWGFSEITLGGARLVVASPAKAVLDYWHLHSGDWTPDRQREMRWQALDEFPFAELAAAVDRAARPRLARAHQAFLTVAAEQ